MTIRNIPVYIDKLLRRKSKEEGKSLNEAAIEAITRGLGAGTEEIIYSDLDDLIGTWVHDPDCEAALDEMDKIDEGMWL